MKKKIAQQTHQKMVVLPRRKIRKKRLLSQQQI